MAGQEDIRSRHINVLKIEQQAVAKKFRDVVALAVLLGKKHKELITEIKRRRKEERLRNELR